VEWSIEAFAGAESIGAIVVAVPAGRDGGLGGKAVTVAGGEHRSESVAAGLARVGDAELVAVHDAARPLVTPELIDELVEKLASRPDAAAVIAAAALTDTVKRAREPRPAKGEIPRGGPTVAQTMSRDHLWAAQTPQVFRVDALREALAADPQRVAAATDDAMLVEKAGGKVLIHPSPAHNMKVTTALDLRVAELLLAERR
jgi:2-C-methyl-D-erythritol 4-phosphate cytidylyltransferase